MEGQGPRTARVNKQTLLKKQLEAMYCAGRGVRDGRVEGLYPRSLFIKAKEYMREKEKEVLQPHERY